MPVHVRFAVNAIANASLHLNMLLNVYVCCIHPAGPFRVVQASRSLICARHPKQTAGFLRYMERPVLKKCAQVGRLCKRAQCRETPCERPPIAGMQACMCSTAEQEPAERGHCRGLCWLGSPRSKQICYLLREVRDTPRNEWAEKVRQNFSDKIAFFVTEILYLLFLS